MNIKIDASLLKDGIIRDALVARLASASNAPKRILEELHVHNGNAIADVVSIHSEAHCYEIKGATDSIIRISRQGKFYDLVFPRITVVTTENHIASAIRHAPEHWGVMAAYNTKGSVRLRYIRSAKMNPFVDVRSALMTLWKAELIDLTLEISNVRLLKFNRSQLIEIIVNNLSTAKIHAAIAKKLAGRKINLDSSAPYM